MLVAIVGVFITRLRTSDRNGLTAINRAFYLSAVISAVLVAIAAFAELGDFMEMPMRTYSSGMFSRLAFSVAVHMRPDILMVDEALSAGDAQFRAKADAKMAELRDSARAMFLVSHGLGSIKDMCNDCLWLHKGRVMMHGCPEECITAYTEFVKVGRTPSTMEEI